MSAARRGRQGRDAGFELKGVSDRAAGRETARQCALAHVQGGRDALVAGPSAPANRRCSAPLRACGRSARAASRRRQGDLMMLPQRPYIPLGSLREAVAYPKPVDAYPDGRDRKGDESRSASALSSSQLDKSDLWQMRLSGGEQQRLAVARALLCGARLVVPRRSHGFARRARAKPISMARSASELPDATLISIGHRSTLDAFHKRRIELKPHAGAAATVA